MRGGGGRSSWRVVGSVGRLWAEGGIRDRRCESNPAWQGAVAAIRVASGVVAGGSTRAVAYEVSHAEVTCQLCFAMFGNVRSSVKKKLCGKVIGESKARH